MEQMGPGIGSDLMEEMKLQLDQLRLTTSSDFSALAWADGGEGTVRWRLASGHRNDRFRRMAFRSGKDLAGLVLRTGQPMSYTVGAGHEAENYPMLLAEQLVASAAAPLVMQGAVRGVVQIGRRSCIHYDTAAMEQLSVVVRRLEELVASVLAVAVDGRRKI